jgi:hypothetical protein
MLKIQHRKFWTYVDRSQGKQREVKSTGLCEVFDAPSSA